MAATKPSVVRGLPISPTCGCYPALSPVRIDRETVELESTAFAKSIGASHGTTALSHPPKSQREPLNRSYNRLYLLDRIVRVPST